MMPGPPPGYVDTTTPETQFADEVRNWITTYAQTVERAQQVVNIAYARAYLTAGGWPDDTALSQADLNACIDLANELSAETDDQDKTLMQRLRRDL